MNTIAWYKGNAVIVQPAVAEALNIKRGHVIRSDNELFQIIAMNAHDMLPAIYRQINLSASMTPEEITSRAEMLDSIDHPKPQP